MQAATAVWTWSFHQKTFIIWKCMFRIFSFSLSLTHFLSLFLSPSSPPPSFVLLFASALFSSDVCAWRGSKLQQKEKCHENETDLMKCLSVCRAHIFHFSQVGVEGRGVFSSSFSWWLLLLSLASLYLENSLEKLVSREKVFGWLFFQKYHK